MHGRYDRKQRSINVHFHFTNLEGLFSFTRKFYNAELNKKDILARRRGSLKDKVLNKFSGQGHQASQASLYGDGLPRYHIRFILCRTPNGH